MSLSAIVSTLMLASLCVGVSARPVKTGLDVLVEQDLAPLQGKKIGLVTNPTGITSDYRTDIDVFAQSDKVKLVALYGPEHGVRGDIAAGEEVADAHDSQTGILAYSLYGKRQKPTGAMLRGVEALVYDIQDIGSRSYTFISTLGVCMEAAAEHHIPFYVLDRPNPLGGDRVEGNILEPKFKSFVGLYPVAYCHGMTTGELAQIINGKGWLKGGVHCELHVVAMEGWKRSMSWTETGLPWVLTSPHIPHAETSLFYAATGIAGELTSLSIGVGYTLPFELSGAPGVSGTRMAETLNARQIPGVMFRPLAWKQFYAVFSGRECGGVQVVITDPAQAPLTRINFEVMDALRKAGVNPVIKPKDAKMFDLVCGTAEVRKMFAAGASAGEIWERWNAGSTEFRQQREPYLLYR